MSVYNVISSIIFRFSLPPLSFSLSFLFLRDTMAESITFYWVKRRTKHSGSAPRQGNERDATARAKFNDYLCARYQPGEKNVLALIRVRRSAVSVECKKFPE